MPLGPAPRLHADWGRAKSGRITDRVTIRLRDLQLERAIVQLPPYDADPDRRQKKRPTPAALLQLGAVKAQQSRLSAVHHATRSAQQMPQSDGNNLPARDTKGPAKQASRCAYTTRSVRHLFRSEASSLPAHEIEATAKRAPRGKAVVWPPALRNPNAGACRAQVVSRAANVLVMARPAARRLDRGRSGQDCGFCRDWPRRPAHTKPHRRTARGRCPRG